MTETSSKEDWISHYRAAMLEVDLSLLSEQVRVAEQAIEQRKQELSSQEGQQSELRRMNDALQNLRVLKRELSIPPLGAVPDEPHSHPELEGNYVVFVSPDRRYTAVTDGVCQLLGYSREELLSMKIDDLTAPELKPDVPETFDRYVQKGHLQGEYALIAKNGHRITILYEALVFPDGCISARWHPLKK